MESKELLEPGITLKTISPLFVILLIVPQSQVSPEVEVPPPACYVLDWHESDLATLVRIAAVLGATTDSLLLSEQDATPSVEPQALMTRLTAATEALEVNDLRPAVRMIEVLLEDRRSH